MTRRRRLMTVFNRSIPDRVPIGMDCWLDTRRAINLIYGPIKRKMKHPTQRAIYEMFYAIRIPFIRYPDKPWERTLNLYPPT
ncbi:MAG TPA: hypothetical protein DIW17_14050 [Clostridiales bacterium]|nr:hypothetical protein [Clostridiales bacterium]